MEDFFPRSGREKELDLNSTSAYFPGGSDSKASACNAGDPGSIPGSGRSLEKEMATHSSILAWRIPWTEEPNAQIGSVCYLLMRRWMLNAVR